MFITLEGIDGCGKSTQAALLEQALRRQGRRVRLTREPGGTELGERLRSVLLDGGLVAPRAELMIYLADRAQHVEQVIRPALSRRELVICERYADSTLAYQGYGRGLDLELLRRLNEFATGGLRPELTVVLELSPELARARKWGLSLDRLESEPDDFHARVARGYQELARAEPARFRIVSADRPPDEVLREILGIIKEKL